mgnify:CR=1 FL=1
MARKTLSRDAALMAALGTAAFAVALGMGLLGRASWLEAASFVTGALCVWLTVRENVWNFPIGLVNVTTFCVVFADTRLYADAGLQVVYFVLGVVGWRMWLRGGVRHTALHISRSSRLELLLSVGAAAIGTLVLWRTLRLVGGSESFLDALTTSISLASQWLLNRKRLESWLGWIAADLIYVPLYLSRGLTLTAILYAVFLGMAILGYRRWRAQVTAPEQTDASPETPLGKVALS